jgi:hypothetical protein
MWPSEVMCDKLYRSTKTDFGIRSSYEDKIHKFGIKVKKIDETDKYKSYELVGKVTAVRHASDNPNTKASGYDLSVYLVNPKGKLAELEVVRIKVERNVLRQDVGNPNVFTLFSSEKDIWESLTPQQQLSIAKSVYNVEFICGDECKRENDKFPLPFAELLFEELKKKTDKFKEYIECEKKIANKTKKLMGYETQCEMPKYRKVISSSESEERYL